MRQQKETKNNIISLVLNFNFMKCNLLILNSKIQKSSKAKRWKEREWPRAGTLIGLSTRRKTKTKNGVLSANCVQRILGSTSYIDNIDNFM